ncbi:basic amino acid ABC transporter substrate-binding protein [uncultured Eubacterium sp.]|uniref:basic amino acid ABC transporter substrate-binding protein n=1 Tax=uncultured Eubacterium sp. TaxID=165185 RepID=UPI0025DAA23F|nr:basic amino acid ABC transporter substrate-binding protein [uncultured Eubacterium sp.]MDO4363370.1 basic amino acid ABC transporter substrate-binding protein [Clostridia bacterium]
MKKFLAVLLAALMICISFVACSSEKKSDDTNTDTDTQETLTMATNAEFPPYEYKEGDNVVGIDAEVAQAIADKLGMKLEIVDTKFDAIIPGVQSGKYDMGMAGMTVTPEREQSVSFSDSYATGIQSIIVKQGSDIKSVDDLSEKTKIGVQLGTTGDIYAKDDFGDEAVQEYDKGADAVQALIAGKIDCVIIDNEPAKSFVAANEGLEILKTSYAEEDYAICFKKDNTELQTKVNDALKELIADGTVQKIVDKYITAD